MRYQGGKSKIAPEIAKVISERMGKNKCFVSLFCGSCSVETKLASQFENVICNDNHYYLMELYKALQNGYIPPDYVTEEEYKRVKQNINSVSPEYAGFVGFGSSFGGKWFGGYGKSTKPNGEVRWHSQESKRALLRDIKHLQNVKFTCNDYKDVELLQGCVIYADPPYDGTTGYGKEKFDSKGFWEYARNISKEHLMFISEQVAPDDFISVWEKPFTRTLDRNKSNYFKVTEKLFIHECNQNKAI